MAGGKLALRHHALHGIRQLQQAQRVRHMAAALADDAGEIRLGVAKLGDQLLIAQRLLKGVEIRPLDVFDDGELERLAVTRLDEQDGHLVQAGTLPGPPATLSGDDLVNIRHARQGPHQDRLDDALLADGPRQVLELLLVKALAGIAGVRAQELDGNAALPARALDSRDLLAHITDKGRQATSKTRPHRFFSHSLLLYSAASAT